MLELRGVTARYGRLIALRDVDLSVPEGAVVAVLGTNGAGKTTLLRAVSRIVCRVEGEVVLDGVHLESMRPEQVARAGVAHVLEGRGVFPRLTVADNLAVAAGLGRDPDMAELALSSFPILGSRMRQRGGSLSGGEQQMLALARAIQTRPKVLMVDEPSLGLAPRIIDELYEAFGRLASLDITIVLVEQFASLATSIATMVCRIDKGELHVESESPLAGPAASRSAR